MNSYGSLTSTFVGADTYNKPLPVLPPADLALATNLFSPQFMADRDAALNAPVCKFDISENPYLRSFGLFSNLADGLVNAAGTQGVVVKLELRRYATTLQPGSLSVVKGSKGVTGVGTSFVNSSAWVGKPIAFYDDNGIYCRYIVAAVTSTTLLTLKTAATSTATGKKFTNQDAGLSGTIANSAGSATVTGTNTLFLSEVAPGMQVMWTDDNFNIREGTVSAVASNTSLTLTAVTSNVAGSMFNATGANVAPATTAAKLYPLVETSTSTTIQIPTMNTLFTHAFPLGTVTRARPIRGRVSIAVATAGGANVLAIGFDTKFTEDVIAGQTLTYIADNGNRITVLVSSVDSDTQLTLVTPASGTAGVALAATKIQIVWTDAFWAARAQIVQAMAFYTIAIDPAFGNGTRRLSFSFVGEIEHNQSLMNGL